MIHFTSRSYRTCSLEYQCNSLHYMNQLMRYVYISTQKYQFCYCHFCAFWCLIRTAFIIRDKARFQFLYRVICRKYIYIQQNRTASFWLLKCWVNQALQCPHTFGGITRITSCVGYNKGTISPPPVCAEPWRQGADTCIWDGPTEVSLFVIEKQKCTNFVILVPKISVRIRNANIHNWMYNYREKTSVPSQKCS